MQRLFIGLYGFTKTNVAVIHNGIYITENIKRKCGKRVLVGSAGRLYPVKGFHLLIDVADIVVKNCDDVDFVIAGDGPLRKVLEEKIRRYGLQERFNIIGHKENMDTFYKSIDIYINTSIHEGIPMSVLEAMSNSLPIVAPKTGGLPEIIQDREQGFLIEGREKNIYVKRLKILAIDKDLRLKMAKSARAKVMDCFSREVMADKYCKLYRELINRVI